LVPVEEGKGRAGGDGAVRRFEARTVREEEGELHEGKALFCASNPERRSAPYYRLHDE
jgi:hypothetical protein